jgi:hypothetical protein
MRLHQTKKGLHGISTEWEKISSHYSLARIHKELQKSNTKGINNPINK